MTTAHDLLVEPLLSWRDVARRRGMTTLPGLLARLGDGDLGDFPKVRPHQFHPWSMFLTQLAAIARHRAGGSDAGATEEEWRKMLLALTQGAHEPWCLVVEDLSRPAFFQPPIPEATAGWKLDDEWNYVRHPDDMDILVTSKAHDVKESRLDPASPELWVYSLTTLQTMQGYPGRGYNSISRMKGGYGNRPRVGLATDQQTSHRFVRDVAVLLDAWKEAIRRGYRERGAALVWMLPWNGAASLSFEDLCPHFIEVCWRVRARLAGERLQFAYTTTSARRCLPEVSNGDVADPWIPVDSGDGFGEAPPRTRGWTLLCLPHLPPGAGSPAHVGMDRTPPCPAARVRGSPAHAGMDHDPRRPL